MVKSQLVTRLAEKQPQLSTQDVEFAVQELLTLMSDALSRGDRIEVRGFGSFANRYHEARVARNPKTGEKVATKAKFVPHFKPGKELRVRLNKVFQSD